MRIAILSPVWFAVPPSGYGGIEWVVSLLADGLSDAGSRRGPDLDLAQPAPPEAGAQLGGQLPERARPAALPVQASPRRVPALPRPDEPGQGRAPSDLGR